MLGFLTFSSCTSIFLSHQVFGMKKVKAPLLRGNKIMSAYIQNDIKLLDAYNFVSTALSKFTSIFQLDELKKGFFPHLFNRPDMWDYSGSIPAEEYYQPDTMNPTKRAEFKEWYAEQLRKEVRFNFKEEMIAYCHSDVELL